MVGIALYSPQQRPEKRNDSGLSSPLEISAPMMVASNTRMVSVSRGQPPQISCSAVKENNP